MVDQNTKTDKQERPNKDEIKGDFYIFDLTQSSFEAPRGIGFVRIYESPPIKKLLNQGWCGLLLRGGPVRHLGDAAGVNLDRCGGRPQCLSETAFLQLYQPV